MPEHVFAPSTILTDHHPGCAGTRVLCDSMVATILGVKVHGCAVCHVMATKLVVIGVISKRLAPAILQIYICSENKLYVFKLANIFV